MPYITYLARKTSENPRSSEEEEEEEKQEEQEGEEEEEDEARQRQLRRCFRAWAGRSRRRRALLRRCMGGYCQGQKGSQAEGKHDVVTIM